MRNEADEVGCEGGGVSKPCNPWPQIPEFVDKVLRRPVGCFLSAVQVSATQMETHSSGRADDEAICRFGEAIADSIVEFMSHFYGYRASETGAKEREATA